MEINIPKSDLKKHNVLNSIIAQLFDNTTNSNPVIHDKTAKYLL
jgi:hypothetical protein